MIAILKNMNNKIKKIINKNVMMNLFWVIVGVLVSYFFY
jgi:hypothetical protein